MYPAVWKLEKDRLLVFLEKPHNYDNENLFESFADEPQKWHIMGFNTTR